MIDRIYMKLRYGTLPDTELSQAMICICRVIFSQERLGFCRGLSQYRLTMIEYRLSALQMWYESKHHKARMCKQSAEYNVAADLTDSACKL